MLPILIINNPGAFCTLLCLRHTGSARQAKSQIRSLVSTEAVFFCEPGDISATSRFGQFPHQFASPTCPSRDHGEDYQRRLTSDESVGGRSAADYTLHRAARYWRRLQTGLCRIVPVVCWCDALGMRCAAAGGMAQMDQHKPDGARGAEWCSRQAERRSTCGVICHSRQFIPEVRASSGIAKGVH